MDASYLDQNPKLKQKRPPILTGRPRSLSNAGRQENANALPTLGMSGKLVTLFKPKQIQPESLGLIDIDHTLLFPKSKANIPHGAIVPGIDGVINKTLLDFLWSRGIRTLYAFTKMSTFSLEVPPLSNDDHGDAQDADAGSVLERLRLCNYLEKIYRYSALETEGFTVLGVITPQDYAFHIPLKELRLFIDTCTQDHHFTYAEHLDNARRDATEKTPNPYKNIELLRAGALVQEQFTVGMAFGYALCELYAKHVYAKHRKNRNAQLSNTDLATLKRHLSLLLTREKITKRVHMEQLLKRKYEKLFKQGVTFKQACDDLDETDFAEYNFTDHADFAGRVSDVLVSFCTAVHGAGKLLMFSQYLLTKSTSVKIIAVIDDKKIELDAIAEHPWAKKETGSSSLITLHITDISMSMEELVNATVTPPSTGSEEEKDQLTQEEFIQVDRKKFGRKLQ